MPTLAGTLLNPDGSAFPGAITFTPLASPLVDGAVLISAAPRSVTPDANGWFSLALAPGLYRVDDGVDRAFNLRMPADNATHLLSDLLAGGAALGQTQIYAVPTFAFARGALLLTNQTDGQPYAVALDASLGVAITAPPPPAAPWPAARILAGCLQWLDQAVSPAWHTVWLGATGGAPELRVGDATVSPAQRCRTDAVCLQLPNLDAGGYHALTLTSSTGGGVLAFGPNES